MEGLHGGWSESCLHEGVVSSISMQPLLPCRRAPCCLECSGDARLWRLWLTALCPWWGHSWELNRETQFKGRRSGWPPCIARMFPTAFTSSSLSRLSDSIFDFISQIQYSSQAFFVRLQAAVRFLDVSIRRNTCVFRKQLLRSNL